MAQVKIFGRMSRENIPLMTVFIAGNYVGLFAHAQTQASGNTLLEKCE